MLLPGPQPGGTGGTAFGELLELLRQSQEVLVVILDRLVADGLVEPDLVPAVEGTRQAIGPAAERAMEEIASGLYDESLLAHHLADGDPAWALKWGLFRRRHQDFYGYFGEQAERGRAPRWLKGAKRVLRALNVILGSLATSIPGGGVYKELKESTEAAVDDTIDEIEDSG